MPTGFEFIQFAKPDEDKNRIGGILFDFDGTLTSPDGLDFAAIRAAIGCPDGQTILEFITALPEDRRRVANGILEEFEREAAQQARPNHGAENLITRLKERGIPFSILTRNLRSSVDRSLEKFSGVSASDFVTILTREEAFAPKPDPEGIRVAAERMNIRVQELLVVGDFRYDIEAGTRAGALTAFLANRPSGPIPELLGNCEPDFVVNNLEELWNLIRYLSPLPAGKLPNDLLSAFLSELGQVDASILVGPRAGQDFAAVHPDSGSDLVLKSDPITFATDRIGHYAVTVNANDLATSGCTPRWLLATALFPPLTTPAQIHGCFKDLVSSARTAGLTLCGGHTEITQAVRQPVIVAFAAGTVPYGKVIDKSAVAPGDEILLTKTAGLEGTALIARELRGTLLDKGIPPVEVDRSASLLDDPGISILTEAQIAAASGAVTAMHDVTEGGVASALEELSLVGGHRIRVAVDAIPVRRETMRMAETLRFDPLGLIGSGALLIVCRRGAALGLIEELTQAGIQVTAIGEVRDPGTGIEAINSDGSEAAWPRFERDEIARLL